MDIDKPSLSDVVAPVETSPTNLALGPTSPENASSSEQTSSEVTVGQQQGQGQASSGTDREKGLEQPTVRKEPPKLDAIQSISPVANSPYHFPHPYQSPSSPNRHHQSSSPRLSSPASSQIFERSVQENAIPSQSSAAIPSHIQTENHIPPVLEASSIAITDTHLGPDDVEIVTASAHLPASVTVTGASSTDNIGSSWTEELVAYPEHDEPVSQPSTLDSHRLSFISFADVVQTEHAHTDHPNAWDSVHLGDPSISPPSPAAGARSPSPLRSPGSSHGLIATPPLSGPTSGSTSVKGFELSPPRTSRGPGSPISIVGTPPPRGELTIETMRQALQKTGTSDVSGVMSQPLSAVSTGEDVTSDKLGHH